jgi:hypothetical protein
LRYLRIGSHELLVVGQGSQQHRPVVTVLALKERKVSSTNNRQNTAVLEFHRIGQEFAGRNKNGTVSALSASQPGTNEQSVAILACFCLGSGETRVSELLCGSISDREFALQSKHPIESVNSEPVSDIFVQDPESNLAHLALFSQLCYFMGEKQLELRTTATGTASSSLQVSVFSLFSFNVTRY